jgi:hypothetical protein
MRTSWIAAGSIVLGFLLVPQAGSQGRLRMLKEERMILEYNAAEDEASVVLSAESEVGVEELHVRGPTGTSILEIHANGAQLGLYGLNVENGEASLGSILATYPEGVYHLRARTASGGTALGAARFSHTLLPAPVVNCPLDGAVDVPTDGLSVSWVPDSGASRYRITLEQGETDLLAAEVRSGSGAFRIPDGILNRGERYAVEIAAIAPNGNATLVKVPFSTR